jgi:16S rRNA C1402 (ribose-2'-O) methylase RsmI
MQPAKGEVTIVIGGAIGEASVWDADQVRGELAERLNNGEKLNTAAKEIAKMSGWNKRDIYTLGTHGI